MAFVAPVLGFMPKYHNSFIIHSLPETISIFPSPMLDSELTKMQAAANDALVQRTLHPPRIPRKPAAAGGLAGLSTTGSARASSSGARPVQKQASISSPSGQAGKKRKSHKGKALPVPHGNFGFRPPIAPPWRLDGLIRSTGCLPPSPCPSGLSEVSEVLRWCRGFSVQGPVFWTFFGSSSFHPGHGSGLLYYGSVRVQDPSLLGRLACPRILVPGDHAGEGLSTLAMRSVGYTRQPFQEYRHSASKAGLSRHDFTIESFEGFSHSSSCAQGDITRFRVRVLQTVAAHSLALSSGGHVISLDGGSRLRMRSLQHRLLVAGPQLRDKELVSWDDSCLQDLRWWSVAVHLEVGVPLDLPHPDLILYTDASDTGWGASLGSEHLSGLWSPSCSLYSINH